MNAYEKIIDEFNEIHIREIDIGNCKKWGKYCDNKILINSNMTLTQKKCVLVEELGHHFTSYGDISDLTKVVNIKQELRARRWGYERLVCIRSIIQAYEYGCRNIYEMAEYLNVTASFLESVFKHYKEKYHTPIKIDTYLVSFHPLFGIL